MICETFLKNRNFHPIMITLKIIVQLSAEKEKVSTGTIKILILI